MDQIKKEMERNFLNCFKELFSEFPQNQLQESEEPDFLITTQNEILGIEITELYRKPINSEPILQEQESLRKQLADMSSKLYEKIKRHPIIVNLHFNSVNPLKKKNLESIAQKINDLVTQNIPKIDDIIILKTVNLPENFPNELHTIIINGHKITKNFWCVANSGWGHNLTISEIQKIIEKKNEKVCNYVTKNHCDKLWLLIITSGYNISTTMDLSNETIQYKYKTKFDRLFILNDMKELIELRKINNIGDNK